MKEIEYLFGSEKINVAPMQPYSEPILDFCSDFSSALMKSAALRKYPDITALAFWCRKGNVNKMKERCPEAADRLGRGLCFHIAPGNIPINFAFSYLFGVLAGCANLVRLPSREFPQTKPVLEILEQILEKHKEIGESTAFVRYKADAETTAKLSAEADARMIWGGDNTIDNLREMRVKPRCIDICFADRYSICILNGKSVSETDDRRLKKLAENFYNDTYLMDQNACSSPQLIFWQNDSEEARKRFWNAVYDAAKTRYNLQPALSVDKYTHMCEDAVDFPELSRGERRGNLLYRLQISSLENDLTKLRGTGGYFYEYSFKNFYEITPYINGKFQTVTYFGLNPEKIQEWVIDSRVTGIDRIVPVGKAMDIGIIWDGFDLVRILSRVINIE